MQARIRLFQLGLIPIINSQNFLQNDEENKSATDRGREANRSTPRYVMEGCTPSTPPLKTPYNISMAADCRKRHSSSCVNDRFMIR